jgi:hypothetical protein
MSFLIFFIEIFVDVNKKKVSELLQFVALSKIYSVLQVRS